MDQLILLLKPLLDKLLLPSEETTTPEVPPSPPSIPPPKVPALSNNPVLPALPVPRFSGHLPQTAGNQGVLIPFQVSVFHINAASDSASSYTIRELSAVQTLLPYFRDVVVKQADVVVFPTVASKTVPASIDLCWSPSYKILGSEVLSTPSSTRFNIGLDPALISSSLPCDFGHINPIIKSPIPYDDHPRLNIKIYQASGASSSVPLGELIIRGILQCSNPLPN